MDERTRRVAENEALFREVNERVVGSDRRPAEGFEILCECGDEACMDRVPVTTEVYERARSQRTDFVLRPGHAIPEFETVIESNEEFDVVRKTGEAAALVNERNSRPQT